MAPQPVRARGELEAEVLALLRAHGEPVGAGRLRDEFEEPRPALTTVLTVLSRLCGKGEVVRSGLSPRRQRFQATRTGDEQASRAMAAALHDLDADDRRAALLRFAGTLDHDDVQVLLDSLSPRRRGR